MRVLIVALGGQRRLARLAGRRSCDATWRRSSSARRPAASAVVLAGMEAPPNFGRDVHRRVSRRVSRAGEAVQRRARAVSARGRRRHRVAEPARRHSSDRRRRRASWPTTCGPCSSPFWRRPLRAGAGKALQAHDRAARGFQDRHERQRAAHDSSPADGRHPARPVHRDRRAVGQRQVDAARPHRRPRCADVGLGPHRRRRHHPARRGRAREAARREDRVRVPVLSPDSVADGARERRGADGDRRRGGRRRRAPRRCSRRWG